MNKRLVEQILKNPLDRLWTVQGFGKIATNITSNARLHIWDRILVNPEVPAIHSHASDFQSIVLAGCMRNLKFSEAHAGDAYNKILALEGQEITRVFLQESPIEIYREGAQYKHGRRISTLESS